MPFFGFLTPNISAYYCDSVNGNDSNAGTFNAPFLTIAHMASVDAGANKNRWRLMTGSSWKEQLTVPRAGMTIDAYGPGAPPLLDCSDVISPGAWTKTTGLTSVYQATLTVPSNVPSNADWYSSVWENNTRYTIAHSTASVDATASSYYPVSVNSTTITLYIHVSDGSNPATNGFTLEYAARMAGIMAQNVNNVTLIGLRTRRNINANGSIIVGKDCLILNCICEEGNKHNCFFDSGTRLIGVQCKGSYYEDLGSSMFVGFGTADSMRGFDLINCSAVNMGLSDTSLPSFYVHSSVLGQTFKYVNFQNCSGLIAFSACLQAIVHGCTSTGGIAGYDAASLQISNSSITFSGNDQYGISAPNTACAVVISGSTVTGPSKSGSPGTTCLHLAVAGSSLVANGSTFQTATNLLSAVGAAIISVQNCIVDVFHYGYTDSTGTPTFSVDHNTYNGFNSTEWAILNGVGTTYAQWKATGQDAHSTP